MKLIYHIASILGIGIFLGCFITSIVQYDEYIAGHFPLHLAVFGVPIVGIPAIIIHWHGESTGWKNK